MNVTMTLEDTKLVDPRGNCPRCSRYPMPGPRTMWKEAIGGLLCTRCGHLIPWKNLRLTIQPRDQEDEPTPSNQASSRAASPSPGMEQSNHILTANHRGDDSASTPDRKSGISRNP